MDLEREERRPGESPPWRKLAGLHLLIIAALFIAISALPATSAAAALLGVLFSLFILNLLFLLAAPPDREYPEEQKPHPISLWDRPPAINELMQVESALEKDGVQVFRGGLRHSAARSYRRLKEALGKDTIPLLQQDDETEAAIVLIPATGKAEPAPRNAAVNWVLFAVTLVTTTYAGAAQLGLNPMASVQNFLSGVPYSAGIMAILGVHELGHYLAARKHGLNVTPPYFIPVPFGLGTFGAFIQLRSQSEDRRALFDVAVAGPLAGLIVAIPVLLMGLSYSEVLPAAAVQASQGEASRPSILFGLTAQLWLGESLAQGDIVKLSPLAFAGWLGLIITALNLLPIGQLDGGHIAHAMFGRRGGDLISGLTMSALFTCALFIWPGLMMWALIVFFLAGRSAPPLNDLSPIGPGRKALGYCCLLLLCSMVVPMPRAIFG